MCPDQDCNPTGVAERQAGTRQDYPELARGDQRGQLPIELRAGRHIEFAGDGQDYGAVFAVLTHLQIPQGDRPRAVQTFSGLGRYPGLGARGEA